MVVNVLNYSTPQNKIHYKTRKKKIEACILKDFENKVFFIGYSS